MYKRISHRGMNLLFDSDTLFFHLLLAGQCSDRPFPERAPQNTGSASKSRTTSAEIATVNLENFSGCNLDCSYCFAAEKHNPPHKMPMSTATAALEFFGKKNKGTAQADEIYLDFTGTGEPLLNFKLIKTMAERVISRRMKKYFLRFTTNATLMSDEIIGSIKRLNKARPRILRLSVSFDGPPAISEIRQGEAGMLATQAAVRAVKKIKKSGIFHLVDNVNSTFTFDLPFLAYRLQYLYLLGFREIIIKPYRGTDNRYCLTRPRLSVLKKEYRRITDFLLSKILAEKKYGHLFAILNPSDFYGRFLLRVFKHSAQDRRCQAGSLSFFVDHKGDVFPCPSFGADGIGRLGSVDTGIKAEALERAKAVTGLLAKCKKCWAKKLCGGECPYETLLRKSETPNALLCELNKFLIKEAAYFFAMLALNNKEAIGIIEQHLREKRHIYFK